MKEKIKPIENITATQFVSNVRESCQNFDKFAENLKKIWSNVEAREKLNLVTTSQLMALSDENIVEIVNNLIRKRRESGDELIESITDDAKIFGEDLRDIDWS